MKKIILLLVVFISGGLIGYHIGYDKREFEFQNNPVLFWNEEEPVIYVRDIGEKYYIKIYHQELVELSK